MCLSLPSPIGIGAALPAPALFRHRHRCSRGNSAMNNIMAAAGLASESATRIFGGKVAVVTGSTSGIGLGIAGALARNGAMIVLNGFGDRAEIEQLCLTLNARHDVPVLYDDADMSKPDAIHDMVERIGRSFGPVD